MKAPFIRKASDLKDWKNSYMLFKPKAQEFVVEKHIELSNAEFKDFQNDFFKAREFIKDNEDLMYCDNGTMHCIAIYCKDSEMAILVESEGYDYARYTSITNKKEVTVC